MTFEVRPLDADERCDGCGEAGAVTVIETAADPETGYRDTRVFCHACLEGWLERRPVRRQRVHRHRWQLRAVGASTWLECWCGAQEPLARRP
jgi:hypothetical protein